MTELLFRQDAYLKECDSRVLAVNERGGIVLDRTVFYPTSGGQPGDGGTLTIAGNTIAIATSVYDEAKNIVHVPATPAHGIAVGAPATARLDWDGRFRNMRCHTLMHLLCASVPFPVTGSAITEDGGRIDFDIPEGRIPDKAELAARLNRLVGEDHPVSERWIADAELDANPELVRTMFVMPPRGSGRVRLVMIGEGGAIDTQPCGGTHLKSTAPIGPVAVARIENKGKINRRIRVVFQ